MNETDEVPDAEISQGKFFFSKELLPCKLLFFFWNGSEGAFSAYYSMYYKSSGLSAAAIGLRNSVIGTVGLFLGPLWGLMFDFTKYRLTLAIISFFGSTLIKCSIPWVIMAVPNATKNVTSMTNTSITKALEGDRSTGTVVKNPHFLFCVLLAIGVVSDIFSTGLVTFMEGVIVNVIYTRKTKPEYGQQKVFGPVGYALGSFVTGVAIDHYHPKHFSSYAASVYVYFPLILLMLPCIIILSKQAKWNHGKHTVASRSIWQHIIPVIRKPDNAMFLLSVLTSGFLFSTHLGFLSLFIMDDLNTTKTIISLLSVMAVISEVFFYPFSSQIITFCGGPISSVFIGIFAWVLRLLLTSYSTDGRYLLPIQLLHGACYSLSWTAMVQHTYSIFPKEVATTALGLLLQLYFGLPGILTSVVGGQVYQRYGGRKVFRGAVCIGGVWLVLMVLYFIVIKRRRVWLKRREWERNGTFDLLNDEVEVDDQLIQGNSGTSSIEDMQRADE